MPPESKFQVPPLIRDITCAAMNGRDMYIILNHGIAFSTGKTFRSDHMACSLFMFCH